MWVITNFEAVWTGTEVRLVFTTDEAAHLYLPYSYTPFVLTPDWVRRRGQPVQCGFNYVLQLDGCIEQVEAGNTHEHTFYITPIEIPTTIFIFLATSCTYAPGGQTGPPMAIVLIIVPITLCKVSVFRGFIMPPTPPNYATIQTSVTVT